MAGWEHSWSVLPQFLGAIVVLALFMGYYRFVGWFLFGTMKTAAAVVMQYAEEYPGKYLLLVGLPAGYGSGPLYEELLYRGVLLLLFDGVNVFAFIGIVISAVVFGSLHWKGNLFSGIHPNEWWGLKWLRVVFTGILGFLAGLAIVSWQSFWYAYLIHAVWNFVFPLLTVVCLAIFSLIP